MELTKLQIERIAKESVYSIGEWDYKKGICSGSCERISINIMRKLEKQGYQYPSEIYLIEPLLFIDGGFSSGFHKSVILPKQKLIIDTQVWQVTNKRTDIRTRKVIFTFNEYKGKGFSW